MSLLGQPCPRVEGPAKTSGAARFASDIAVPDRLHAALVTSTIVCGRITGFDLGGAEQIAGVVAIFTHRDFSGAIHPVKHLMAGGYANSSFLPLGSGRVAYAGQIVAMVVAESLEAAREAACLVKVSYEEAPFAATFGDKEAETIRLADLKPQHEDPAAGDADTAFAQAPVKIQARYETPTQHHNPIEMFTTTCVWEGEKLTVYEPTRFVAAVQHGLAEQLGIAPEDIRVVAPLIGGHFGSKLALSQHTALVALAAKRLGRPVALVPTRPQCFAIANYRPETRHDISLGAARDGSFTALVHEAEMVTSRFDAFAMEGTDVTASLYACPNIRTDERAVRVDRNTPGPMRAPPEVPYMFALETAVDEMAVVLGMDPIELRRRNDTCKDPISDKAFSTRPLMRCFDTGAAGFGWERRTPVGQARHGGWLVGLGCASSVRPVKIAPATMRVAFVADGRVLVETAHHEIGNGITTLLAMAAEEWLGVAMQAVTVRLGDTDLPPAGLSGGSTTTTSLLQTLHKGCKEIRARQAAGANAPLDVVAEFIPEGGGDDGISKIRSGHIAMASGDGGRSLCWSFGAQFAEVHVHEITGEIRVVRLLGAFSGGRILNPLTARSQLTGGMIWGMGSALLEQTALDAGAYRNNDLAEYLVPTAADVPDVQALLLPDEDEKVNPLGVKGLGELGIIGVNAAIGNAFYNATGKRARRLPIRVGDF